MTDEPAGRTTPDQPEREPEPADPGPLSARTQTPRPQIVYLDSHRERPVSQYSPEGEIRMMGEFAAGLRRRSASARPLTYVLVLIVLLPIVLSLLAVFVGW